MLSFVSSIDRHNVGVIQQNLHKVGDWELQMDN